VVPEKGHKTVVVVTVQARQYLTTQFYYRLDALPDVLLFTSSLDYYYYYINFTAFFSRTTWVSQQQKGKPFWILLEQEMMG